MLKYVRLSNISKNAKLFSRHQNWQTSFPSPFPKPMNPWDNMDPGRTDKEIKDEYDQYEYNYYTNILNILI